jgi:hypothetical protein
VQGALPTRLAEIATKDRLFAMLPKKKFPSAISADVLCDLRG